MAANCGHVEHLRNLRVCIIVALSTNGLFSEPPTDYWTGEDNAQSAENWWELSWWKQQNFCDFQIF